MTVTENDSKIHMKVKCHYYLKFYKRYIVYCKNRPASSGAYLRIQYTSPVTTPAGRQELEALIRKADLVVVC